MLPRRADRYELLIADDDPDFREVLRAVFEPYFSLLEATCGEEALELVESHPVDLALLDMHMRALTGLETVRQFRRLGRQLPCILISADASEELRRWAAPHAARVLKKPVPKAELVSAVSETLESAYDDREISRRLKIGRG